MGVLLDLEIREATRGRKCLRDLFQRMNQEYARQNRFFADSEGVRRAAEAITGADFAPFFRAYVAGVEEIPYDQFFAAVGLKLVMRKSKTASAGFAAVRRFDAAPVVTTVEPDSEAQRAGLSPGDRIISVDDKPIVRDLETLLAGRQPRTLSLIWLKSHEVPATWDDQAALFGRMDR